MQTAFSRATFELAHGASQDRSRARRAARLGIPAKSVATWDAEPKYRTSRIDWKHVVSKISGTPRSSSNRGRLLQLWRRFLGWSANTAG